MVTEAMTDDSREMTATLPRPHAIVAQTIASTVVIVDESDEVDSSALLAALANSSGPVTIVVTRRPPPPTVFSIGAGVEAVVMWTDARREYQSCLETTSRRTRELGDLLSELGIGPIRRADSIPTTWAFRGLRRREVDGALRQLREIQPDRIIVDRGHRLHGELRDAISSTPEIAGCLTLA